MKIRSTLNGGSAEVDDVYGRLLIAAGGWVVDGEEPAAPKTRRTRAKNAPAEEPSSEE